MSQNKSGLVVRNDKETEWSCPQCTYNNSGSESKCKICSSSRDGSSELSEAEKEKLKAQATEAMSMLFNTEQPSHAGTGIMNGFGNIFRGVGSGAVALVGAPIVGAKEEGVTGFVKGFGLGVISAASLTVAGAATGVSQVAKGIINSPEAIIAASEGKEWDPEQEKWIIYNLVEEADRVLKMTDEQFVESLKNKQEGKEENQSQSTTPRSSTNNPNSTSTINTKSVKDREFYDLLGVEPSATPEQIKRAYYIQAKKCHPDKNPDDPNANQRFKLIGEAYQVLSDPDSRRKYDEHGKSGVPDTPVMDSTALFAIIFGSEAFEPYIGELRITLMMGVEQEKFSPMTTIKLRTFKQQQREVKIAVNLVDRLQMHVDGNVEQFKQLRDHEAHDLSISPFGGAMLLVIGLVFVEQASKYLGDPFSSALVEMQAKVRTAGNRYKFLKATIAAYQEATKFQEAHPEMTEETPQPKNVTTDHIKLMETALEAIWQTNVLDIEETLRKSCSKIFRDNSVDKAVRKSRAKALKCLGEIFCRVGEKEGDPIANLRKKMGMEVQTTPRHEKIVKLKNLKATQYNDQIAVIIGPENDDGRIPVRLLQNDKEILVKKDNIDIIEKQKK